MDEKPQNKYTTEEKQNSSVDKNKFYKLNLIRLNAIILENVVVGVCNKHRLFSENCLSIEF